MHNNIGPVIERFEVRPRLLLTLVEGTTAPRTKKDLRFSSTSPSIHLGTLCPAQAQQGESPR